MNFALEILLGDIEGEEWQEMKKYNNTSYEKVKEDVKSLLGECIFSITCIDSIFTNVKPRFNENENRLVCLGEC